jgi:hypothetical protein
LEFPTVFAGKSRFNDSISDGTAVALNNNVQAAAYDLVTAHGLNEVKYLCVLE